MARLLSDDALGAATIWQEARGEPYEGKVAVGEVIRNRARLRLFSDGTIAGTVAFPFQFSGWNTKDPNRTQSLNIDDADNTTAECIRAWNASKDSNTVLGATHYFNENLVVPDWANELKLVIKIGNHSFYK